MLLLTRQRPEQPVAFENYPADTSFDQPRRWPQCSALNRCRHADRRQHRSRTEAWHGIIVVDQAVVDRPDRRLGAVQHVQLAQDRLDMDLDGGLADGEPSRDQLVGFPANQPLQDDLFTIRQIDVEIGGSAAASAWLRMVVDQRIDDLCGNDLFAHQDQLECPYQRFARDRVGQVTIDAGSDGARYRVEVTFAGQQHDPRIRQRQTHNRANVDAFIDGVRRDDDQVWMKIFATTGEIKVMMRGCLDDEPLVDEYPSQTFAGNLLTADDDESDFTVIHFTLPLTNNHPFSPRHVDRDCSPKVSDHTL